MCYLPSGDQVCSTEQSWGSIEVKKEKYMIGETTQVKIWKLNLSRKKSFNYWENVDSLCSKWLTNEVLWQLEI